MKRTLFIVLGLLLLLAQINVYFHSGFPYTHDGENHLARFASYKIALREGQIPPRFAPNLFNHYGYPVFNYQYPLANILALPFLILKLNPEFIFKLIVASFLILGFLGVYKLTTKLKYSLFPQVLSILIFGLSPFLFSSITYRGNIGEIMAYGLLPWVLWSIKKIEESKLVIPIIVVSVFALSHNLSVVFSIPLILTFLLTFAQFNKKFMLNLAKTGMISFCLVSWFWLPAILEKGFVNIEQVDLVKQYSQHFITFPQLISSPIQFGYSEIGPVDSMGFQVGITFLAILFIWVVQQKQLFFSKKLKLHFSIVKSYFPFIGLLLFSFLQLSISQPIWQVFSPLQVVQFPWRLSLFLPFFLLLSIKNWRNIKSLNVIVIVLAMVQLISFSRLSSVDYFHKNIVDYEAFTGTTSTQHENATKGFTYEGISQWQPTPEIIGQGSIESVDFWNGSRRNYTVNLESDSIVIEPTMYFPGWKTTVSNNSELKTIDYQPELSQGRISYQLPAGKYAVTTRFTQQTPARMLGNSLFFVGLASFAWILYSQRKASHV